MGLTDLFSDIYASLTWTEAHAEAAPENEEEESGDGENGEEGKEGGDDAEEGEGGGEAEAEEEEEEEEPEDIKPHLEEQCAKSAACHTVKHHYDECVARVTHNQEDEDYKGPHEDCVEEFFHLAHCATQCAAPKLWNQLR